MPRLESPARRHSLPTSNFANRYAGYAEKAFDSSRPKTALRKGTRSFGAWMGRGRDQDLCPYAHGASVIVELLSAFQTCDVGTDRWAVGLMDRRDWPGEEPVMATKQQIKHFANHMLPRRDRNPAHTPSRRNCGTRPYARSILQKVNSPSWRYVAVFCYLPNTATISMTICVFGL